MKKRNAWAVIISSIVLISVATLTLISSSGLNPWALIDKVSASSDVYKIVLDKSNYATVDEVGTFSNPKEGDKLATRKTNLGNDVVFQFASGKGVTNNDGTGPHEKFCQMPGSQYGWVTNKSPILGITKLKITVQQTSASFRIDYSDNNSLEGYYYDKKPSYITYQTEAYTGKTTYDIETSGYFKYFRLQNLGSSHLSLVSLEISYTCSSKAPRGVLKMTADPAISLSKTYTVSEGGTITVDYKFANPVLDEKAGVSMFFGSDETHRFGNYKLLYNQLEKSYNGITFSTLPDGYQHLVVDISKLDEIRTTDGYVAPTTITEISFRWYEVEHGIYFDINHVDKTTQFQMSGSQFKVVNFTDIHVTDQSLLSDTGTVGKTIKYGIEHSKPDILLFSGDLVGKPSDLSYLCNYLDSFEIPYFVILGNHDHEGSLGYDTIAQYINQSQYGYIEKGPEELSSQGNYTIKVKNSSGNLVHGFVMMDTGNKYTISDDSSVEYVTNTVKGVKYGTFNSKTTYCDGTKGAGNAWDGIRGNQVTWFENTAKGLGCETTLICHAGFNEYVKAYEQYQDAVNKSDSAKIAACAPIGQCNMGEQVCGTVENTGLFNAIKSSGTKNVICGHDHLNDFSLLYQGVRLTYSLKTGEGSYWKEDGTRSGYTELTIDSDGQTSLEQIYFNPLA